ncbi:MAG: asparagine synthase-related protein, partial [Sphingobacterium sp.]
MKFKLYNHLGFHNPYYIENKEEIQLYDNFENAITNFKSKRNLDISSVIDIASNGFIYGDKTLVKGISKSPWMAKPNKSSTNWDYFDLPKHTENKSNINDVARVFFQLLKEELLDYVRSYKRIGILLTGGMDSRIVAGVLDSLISEGKLDSDLKIKAYTWGRLESRDVVYAEKISKLCGWDWENLVVDKQQMHENLVTTIENGSEYSPIHLHAMLQLRSKTEEVDCFLAGSFGDSVGRAEYSGTRVVNLTPLSTSKNHFSLIKKGLINSHTGLSNNEIQKYHQLFKQDKSYQQYELDYQLHYMRRMLNACMAVIDEKIPLFQMFSSPNVFGFMWSLDPEFRTNDVYKIILENYSPKFNDIPWARTGLLYPETKGAPDKYLKSHHQYGKLLREEFLPQYKDTILNNDLNIFNRQVLKTIYELCTDKPIHNNYNYEGVLIWIVSLIKTCELYSI